MATQTKGKNKLTDMSIDPSTIKKGTSETEETSSGEVKRVKKARKEPYRYISHHRGHGKVSNYVCVKKGDEVKRVARATVEELFISNGWAYCPKSEWKKARGTEGASVTEETQVPSKKLKKQKKLKETSEA
jgi:hypothetical protein